MSVAQAAIRPVRPGFGALGSLIVAEARMVTRDTAGLVVPFALPTILLVMNASGTSAKVGIADRTALEAVVLPIVIATVMALVGVVNFPSFIAAYRHSGVLQRLAVTPVRPVMVLVAQGVVVVVQALLGIAFAFLVARFALGARWPVDMLVTLAGFAVALCAMCAFGMIVAAIASTSNASVAIGLVTFLGFGAMGGMFGGPESVPEPVREVGALLPYGASVEVLSRAAVGAPQEAAPWIAMGLAVVVGAAVAAWLFRWQK